MSKIVFIALGKFGSEYVKYHYKLKGDVYEAGAYTYSTPKLEQLTGEFNPSANKEFISSFKGLWKWIYQK